MESAAGGKAFTDMKIQSSIFQRGTLSPFLLIIAMITLNPMQKKMYRGGYKLTTSEERINVLMYNGQTVYEK